MPARRPARKPGLIQRMVDSRLRDIFKKKVWNTLGGRGEYSELLLEWVIFSIYFEYVP